ncbi:hypothetical protein CDLVIII_1452 [Clostridium sp. DL-VIII]|uniref:hypothetical protein n=1 Tax=Clostridium sp. DL-VIII TaxID=641107 RepID=UPI00023AF095|nr:hypothetical protein [Clostridium sp. DL-VIII]EHI98145.1 hypothetical protein CDLVIII_1452 [Clostridium sp. DL-VIII]
MSGIMYLYVSDKNGAHKIPKPKRLPYTYSTTYKAVPSLANEEVLLVILCYETVNRKPHELDLISFHRARLDENGCYIQDKEELNNSLINFVNYAFTTSDELALRDTIPIPVAPKNIPTENEKNALYSYVKENYPNLWTNCPYLVEQNVKSIEKHHNELKELVKEAYKKKII